MLTKAAFIKNTLKTVILWNIITIICNIFISVNKYILKCNLFLWCTAEFTAAITPVFSATWFFKK